MFVKQVYFGTKVKNTWKEMKTKLLKIQKLKS